MKIHYGLNDLKDIDIMAFLPIILPVIAVGALLVLIAFIDLYRHRKTRKNVLVWTFIILFVNILGPILYFIIGRKDSGELWN
ncbi:phosphatidylserine synthase [Bacillus sp. AFS059628]|uniref:PLD nuclease N-terminal domain-containing protein n=1 Tax=Bacillus sp. AFS059628 TaxID=2033508 RepID=UPI000BF24F48|nr:PLD nuclease N-terminal domain-containing protein [Bacillus sp. AFS059628]PFV82809.1 phosphatidylserine synthase [Bacillus sp. AFS059628]